MELRPFELICFWQLFCIVGYGVCVIYSSYSFQWIYHKLCRHIVDILEMCMWIFDGARINFNRSTAFKTKIFLVAFCPIGYGVCVINLFYSFQWLFLKHCRHIVDILKMCMWVFDEGRIQFDRMTAF